MDEDIRAKIMQFQQVQEQLEQFTNFLVELEGKLEGMQEVITGLEAMSRQSPGQKLLAPLSNGIFIEADIKNTAEVIVNVGADVCVKKPISDTMKLLSGRQAGVRQHIEEVKSVIEQLRLMEAELSTELREYV
jgi:prefoldin alpha subunit